MAKAAKPKKPTNPLPRLIEKYYAELKDLAHQNVLYEMGTRPAFHAPCAGNHRKREAHGDGSGGILNAECGHLHPGRQVFCKRGR
jgi:hypothetical protein